MTRTRQADSHRIYRSLEALRERWADVMLEALKNEGHVYLSTDEYYKLKGDLMQLLIGRIRT